MIYDSALTLRQARDKYFAINGFSAQGYEEKWTKILVGPGYFYIPNTTGRQEAVRIHDLHHVLNEFDTTLTGEAEIGAWEWATGIPCKYYYGAFLDGLGAVGGLFYAPGRVIRAFRKGLRSRNLYQEFVKDPSTYEGLLNQTVGEVRARLGIEPSQ